jgi:hypothetical protein
MEMSKKKQQFTIFTPKLHLECCLQNLKLLFRFQFSEKMWLFVIYLCVLFISTATMLGEGWGYKTKENQKAHKILFAAIKIS